MTNNQIVHIEDSSVTTQVIVGGDAVITEASSKPVLHSVVFNIPNLISTFRGRDIELDKLHTVFFTNKKHVAVISGLPGLGKTELAKQFVQRCKTNNDIENIIWINSESQSSIENSFKSLLRYSKLEDDSDIQTVIQKVYEYFGNENNMFVFDNALNQQSIANYIPSDSKTCFLLITSNTIYWERHVQTIELDELNTEEANQVLRAILEDQYDENLNKEYASLTNIISCVPLALQIAAANIREEIIDLDSTFKLEEYVEETKNYMNKFIEKSMPESSSNTYTLSLYEAVTKSIKKLELNNDVVSKLAVQILHICAYLSPNNIDSSNLLEISIIKDLCGAHKKKYLRKSLSLLRNYSFIQISESLYAKLLFFLPKITIHKLTQEILRNHQIKQNEHSKFYKLCLELAFNNLYSLWDDPFLLNLAQNDAYFDTFYCWLLSISPNIKIWRALIHGKCFSTLNKLFDKLDNVEEIIKNFNLLKICSKYPNNFNVFKLLVDKGADIRQLFEGKVSNDVLILITRNLNEINYDLLCQELYKNRSSKFPKFFTTFKV